MSQTKSLVLLAGAALSLGGVNTVQAQQSTNPDEVRAIVAEMLSDSQTRSSLLAAGATAGNDGKFFIADAQGNYRLNVGGMIQFRYLMNFRGNSNTVDGGNGADDFDGGFQTRRTKLSFDGNIVNPDWMYRIMLNFDKGAGNGSTVDVDGTPVSIPAASGGNAFLEDAYVTHRWSNGWSATFGQFKIPLLREELVSDNQQLAVERLLVNSAFTQGWSQGFQIAYEEEDWNVKAAFSDGLASQNTDFTNNTLTGAGPAGTPFVVSGEADWAVTGRFEYKFAGNMKDFVDFTSKAGQPFSCLAGAAAHYQQSPNTNNAAGVDRDTFEYTFDISLEGDGWNGYAAFIGRHDEFRGEGNHGNFDDFGAIVQGGYRFGDTEIFARWDALFPDSGRNLDKDAYNYITVGVNEYFAGHAAKATIDCVFALDDGDGDIAGVPITGPGTHGSTSVLPNTGSGLLGSNDGSEIVVRFQFQLLF